MMFTTRQTTVVYIYIKYKFLFYRVRIILLLNLWCECTKKTFYFETRSQIVCFIPTWILSVFKVFFKALCGIL